jgi:pimeloyl-ACP methyl ester carboxylesterase
MKIVKTKTSDGFHFKGLLSEAKDSKKIIIHIHGMAGGVLLNEYYTDMHEYYPANGVSFLAGENRGTGTITEFVRDSSDGMVGNAFEKFENCVLDIQAWVDFARQLGYEGVWLQGHSLAPSKITYYINQTLDHGIKGLIFISPSDMLGLVHDSEGKKDHDIMLPEAKRLVSEGKGTRLIDHKLWGGDLLSANTYLNFFDEGANTGIFNYANDSLGWNVVNSINIPVLAFSGTKDDGVAPIMDPKLAMEKLKSELKNSPRVETIVYEGAEHNFNGFGDKIVKEVINFVNSSETNLQ